MAQICIWTDNEGEYEYIRNICKDIDEDLTDDDFIGSSFTQNQGRPNFQLYENEVGDGFRPIIIFPYSAPEINLVEICNLYPQYYFIQPFYNHAVPVPAVKILDPDRPSPMILVSGGEDGESGWMTGAGLIFTESSFTYDSYDISEIVDNLDGTCRIKCEGLGNLLWSYYADAFGLKIPVYIKDVEGFENNPDGVYYPVAESYYTDPTTNWVDITCNLGAGTYSGGGKAGYNFLSGAVAVVGAKINKIRRERGCEYDEAIAIAKLTASNPDRDDEHGYGSIDTDAAISYSESIPEDEDVSLGEIGTLSYERDNLGYVTFSMSDVRNAQKIRIYSGNEEKYEIDIDYGEDLRFTAAVPAGTYRAVAFQNETDSDSSNEITLNSMALTNRPFKSKYTIGDTVYALRGGIVELTINQVVVEVDDPNDDGVGRQTNTYGFEDQSYTLQESDVYSSKNSLLASLKGSYLNVDGVKLLGINSIDSGLTDPLYVDFAGLMLVGFTFDNSDAIAGSAEIDFTARIIDNIDMSNATFPTNSDTVAELKAMVASYDKLTTIWKDGRPIVDWSGLTINPEDYNSTSGFVSTSAGSNIVTASGDLDFTHTEIANGSYIRINGEEKIVASTIDATHLEVTTNYASSHSLATLYVCPAEDLSSRDLSGLEVVGADFTRCKMPANADTKAEFKALVGSYSSTTTLWIDGTPVG